MQSDRDAHIVFEHVSYEYGDGRIGLEDVNLSIRRGSFVVILGSNGSGKSTLAKHIDALLLPTQGEVQVAGYATDDPEHGMDIRRHAGMVFQNPDDQAVASIVRDDVAFGPENLGIEPAEIRRRVEDALACVHMSDHADAEVHSLSGGQKQRVAIAGVLAMHPEILILDEPGAMLDLRGRRGIARVAHELNAEGMTVVLITHFMEEALAADHVVVLDAGHVALEGTPQEVFTDAQQLRQLHLDLPFSIKLAEDLRARGIEVTSGLDEAGMEEELCLLYSNR